jgi:delta 1-pyrroline-5-carboxylate dehydrogenase
MSCIRGETFGPTLPVVRVADEAEAIRLANDSSYGLSATVWTGDNARGLRVAGQLEVGAVDVNDVFSNIFSFALPMGGWKESGVGARWGGAGGVLILPPASDYRAADTDPRNGTDLVPVLAHQGQVRARPDPRCRRTRPASLRHHAKRKGK